MRLSAPSLLLMPMCLSLISVRDALRLLLSSEAHERKRNEQKAAVYLLISLVLMLLAFLSAVIKLFHSVRFIQPLLLKCIMTVLLSVPHLVVLIPSAPRLTFCGIELQQELAS
jgi:hypothetical protein